MVRRDQCDPEGEWGIHRNPLEDHQIEAALVHRCALWHPSVLARRESSPGRAVIGGNGDLEGACWLAGAHAFATRPIMLGRPLKRMLHGRS